MGPKILLVKPGGGEDDTASHRSRAPWIGSLNLLSDSLPWDFHYDRFLPFLTENTDFTVVGVIGPPGVGKSTVMNHLYGFDASSPGMLPPYAIQSDEVRATARHSSTGIEPRVSSDRLIVLDTQPVFSPSVLAEMMRPDGSSTIPVLGGESLSAELAHEIMNIQLGVFLTSVCHILLVVSDGVHDRSMRRLMSTVDLLKYGIPDPSALNPQSSTSGPERDGKEYMATPIFVHTKLQDQDLTTHNCEQLKKTVAQYFSASSFRNEAVERSFSSAGPNTQTGVSDSPGPNLFIMPTNLFIMPTKSNDESIGNWYESYAYMLDKLRDRVLSMSHPSFSRTVSERDWLKNSEKIWELVKNSAVITEYSRALLSCGLFRR